MTLLRQEGFIMATRHVRRSRRATVIQDKCENVKKGASIGRRKKRR